MATKEQENLQAFLFRVELQNISPQIWREILVPSSYSFWDLHVAIQDSMGWLDYHLHAFRLQDPETGEALEIGIPDDEWSPDGGRVIAGWQTPIRSYLNAAGQTVIYDYDFGDGWSHRIELREIVPLEPGARYPKCVGGERACPPEDCGGIWGYENLLEAISDPAHEEHDSILEWLGGEFDPERFDPATVKFDDPKKRWRLAFEEGD